MPIIQITLLNSFTSHPITFTTQTYTQTVCISIRLKAIFPFDSVHRKFMEKSIFHRCHNYHWTSNPPEIHTIRHFGYIISQFHKEVALWGFCVWFWVFLLFLGLKPTCLCYSLLLCILTFWRVFSILLFRFTRLFVPFLFLSVPMCHFHKILCLFRVVCSRSKKKKLWIFKIRFGIRFTFIHKYTYVTVIRFACMIHTINNK